MVYSILNSGAMKLGIGGFENEHSPKKTRNEKSLELGKL